MSRLATLNETALSPTLQRKQARVSGGCRLAVVYLQLANSEPALGACRDMEASLVAGSLSELGTEGIKLLFSELTQCDFRPATHTIFFTNMSNHVNATALRFAPAPKREKPQ